jgi:AraC family transcriptional regulator
MPLPSMTPSLTHIRSDGQKNVPSEWRGLDQFAVVRFEASGGLGTDVRKSSCVPALLVSVALRAIPRGAYRLWADGRPLSTGAVTPFQCNVFELESVPACWAGEPCDFLHFHLPRAPIDQLAEELGCCERPGALRPAVLAADPALKRITRGMLSWLDGRANPTSLALDDLQLTLSEHVLKRYGGTRRRRAAPALKLARWQTNRVVECLLDGASDDLRLHQLARECELPASVFAKAFENTFRSGCAAWVSRVRAERDGRRSSSALSGPRKLLT